MASLRQIAAAQAQFQAAAVVDYDYPGGADGIGEFGLFRELSGAAPARLTAQLVLPTTGIAPPPKSSAITDARLRSDSAVA